MEVVDLIGTGIVSVGAYHMCLLKFRGMRHALLGKIFRKDFEGQ